MQSTNNADSASIDSASDNSASLDSISSNDAPIAQLSNTQPQPVIIIGSGMAGYTLARELRKLTTSLPIVMVCQDSGDSYAKPTLSNAYAQNKLADTIANASAAKMAETLNLTLLNFHQVTDINTDEQVIVVRSLVNEASQTTLAYRDLVLATGAHSRLLPNLAVNHQTIFAVNHLDEYKSFQQRLNTLKSQKSAPIKVAIIGAGLIGCEFANDLIGQNTDNQTADITVAVFDKAARPLAQQLPSQAGIMLQDALTQSGVTFYLGTDITSITTNVNTNNDTSDKATVTISFDRDNQSQTFEADIVLIAIGLVANTDLAASANIAIASSQHINPTITHLPRTVQQGIKVDAYLATSAEHIYAIGDCANVMGSYMPYVMPLMNQAKALAKTLADPNMAPTKVAYPAMPVAIKTPSLPLVVLPVSGQYSDDQLYWQTTLTTDGMVMTAHPKDDTNSILGFVLAGREAAKQRLTLTKQVADWLS
ncbi:FAD-dependent oxidoreductase [Moraxella osloensis]|nr:FAD-dependent oxidoreductase [Moraxella osloensis]MBW4017540.1 FAD-dependent oxidoreductase [Moraxella osloensis]